MVPNNDAARVLIMAGGTGGHVFPALAVAECLRASGASVAWLGTRRGIEAELVPTQKNCFALHRYRGSSWSRFHSCVPRADVAVAFNRPSTAGDR